MTSTFLQQKVDVNDLSEKIFFSLFILVLSAFFPALTIVVILFFSIRYSESTNNLFLGYVLFILSFCISVIYSAQPKFLATDFGIYYEYYMSIVNGHEYEFSILSFEPGYYFVNYIISLFGVEKEVIFSIVMDTTVIFGIALSTSILIKKKYSQLNIFFVIIIAVYCSKLGSFALLWRQAFSLIFMLLMFSCEKKRWAAFFLILSCLFHFSSIVVGILCYSVYRFKEKNIYYLCVLSCFGFLWSVGLGNVISNVFPPILKAKLEFSLGGFRTDYILDAIKTVIIFIPFIFYIFICNLFGFNQQYTLENRREYLFILLTVCFIMGFSLVPHAFRFIFPFSCVLVSVYTAVIMMTVKDKLLFILFFSYIVAMGSLRFLSPQYSFEYPFFDVQPFYYFYWN